MVAPVRVLLGTSTNPIVTFTREDNLGSVLHQIHLEADDLINLEASIREERRAACAMAISRVTPCVDSLLVFPCLGKFQGDQHGDTYKPRQLLMISGIPDAENDFTHSNPASWRLDDVIDHVGAYVVQVTDTDIQHPDGQLSTFNIAGKLIHHLEPCDPQPFSLRTCTHFPLGLKFKFGIAFDPAGASDSNPPLGNFLSPTPRLTGYLHDGGFLLERSDSPPKTKPNLPAPPSKAAQLSVDGEIIYMYDKTKFGEEKQDCLGFMRAFACLPEKKIKLTGGVQDEHRLSEKVVATCMGIVDAAVGKVDTFPYKMYIPRVSTLPIYSDTAKVLLFLKFKFSLHDLSALSSADLVPANHTIDLSGTNRISLMAMIDGLRHMLVLFIHEGYLTVFDDTKKAIDSGSLTMIPDQVLHICFLFAWAHICDTVTNSTANRGTGWRTNPQMLPDMFKAQLEIDFALDRCLDIERNWITQSYEAKYQLPATKKRSLTTPNPSPAKLVKSVPNTPTATDFCVKDLCFKYDYQSANLKRTNQPPAPCAGKKCASRHVDKGKLPPKSDVIAWLTGQATADPKNKGHLTKLADYVSTHF